MGPRGLGSTFITGVFPYLYVLVAAAGVSEQQDILWIPAGTVDLHGGDKTVMYVELYCVIFCSVQFSGLNV